MSDDYLEFIRANDPFYTTSACPDRTSRRPAINAPASKIPTGLTGLPAIVAAAALPLNNDDIPIEDARKLVLAALDLLPLPRGAKKSELAEAVAMLVRAPTRIFASALKDLIESVPAFEPVSDFRARVEKIKLSMTARTIDDGDDGEPSGLPIWEDWLPDGRVAFDPCAVVARSGRVIERYELRKFDVYRIDRQGESWVHRYTPNDPPLAAYLAAEAHRAV